MSIDKSLVSKGRLRRRRNVLSRDERILLLEKEERWKEGQSVFGLPKVRAVVRTKKKVKKEEKPAEEAVEAAPESAGTAKKTQPSKAEKKS